MDLLPVRIYPLVGEVNGETVKAVIVPEQKAEVVLVHGEVLKAVGSGTNDILKVLGLCVKVDLPDDGDIGTERGT